MDIEQRRRQLERRISNLESQIHSASATHAPVPHIRVPLSCHMDSINRPPLYKSSHHSTRHAQQEIQQLEEIVKNTMQKQTDIQLEIGHLKGRVGSRGNSIDLRRSGDISFRCVEGEGRVEPEKQMWKSNDFLKNVDDEPFELDLEDDQPRQLGHVQEEQGRKKRKSLSIPRPLPNPVYLSLNKTLSLAPTAKMTSGVQTPLPCSVKEPKISAGTKKYVASLIIMRINSQETKPKGKTKSKTDQQLLSEIEKNNKARESLLKKVYKLKNTKKYK